MYVEHRLLSLMLYHTQAPHMYILPKLPEPFKTKIRDKLIQKVCGDKRDMQTSAGMATSMMRKGSVVMVQLQNAASGAFRHVHV